MIATAHSPTQTDGWIHGRDYRIVPVDENRSLLFVTGNHRVLDVSPDLGRRLEDGLELLTTEEAGEWHTLEEAGLLQNIHADVLARSRYADGANLALNINL